jgi:light-regulated signal transduction histidine kinase (bacteriophytochrome)
MTSHASAALAMKASLPRSHAYADRPQARGAGRDKPDMSEREILKRRIVRLETRVQELDAFASSVSHDLRAPLRALVSYARILEEDHAGEMSPAARACLSKIVHATRDMENLIDELLAFSRLDNEPVTMTLVNGRALVERVLANLVVEDADRVQFAVGMLGHCLGSAGLLEQVWTNLVSNALKFSRDRNPAVIEIGSMPRDNIITYYVRDNGVGFDMKRARDLFLPFRRFHDQREYGGQGLGLSIAKRIVERHGGRLWAESRPGEGATFYFTLPRM